MLVKSIVRKTLGIKRYVVKSVFQTHSRLKPMRDFAWMLRRHEEGIAMKRFSNGAVEGMNNKAKSSATDATVSARQAPTSPRCTTA